jgi:DNA replication protein DnaC
MPCQCDIKAAKQQKKDLEEKNRKELKMLINKHFPLPDDNDFDRYAISKFIKRPGTEKMIEKANHFCEKFDSDYKPKGIGLLFTGKPGVGKTKTIKAILGFRSIWNTVVYVENVNIFDRIMSCYQKKDKDTENELYKCLIESDILGFDDIGIGEKSHQVEKMLIKIIDGRKQLKKPIIFGMNPEGEMQLSERILDRIEEICIPVVNTATTFRPEALQQKLKKEGL